MSPTLRLPNTAPLEENALGDASRPAADGGPAPRFHRCLPDTFPSGTGVRQGAGKRSLKCPPLYQVRPLLRSANCSGPFEIFTQKLKFVLKAILFIIPAYIARRCRHTFVIQ